MRFTRGGETNHEDDTRRGSDRRRFASRRGGGLAQPIGRRELQRLRTERARAVRRLPGELKLRDNPRRNGMRSRGKDASRRLQRKVRGRHPMDKPFTNWWVCGALRATPQSGKGRNVRRVRANSRSSESLGEILTVVGRSRCRSRSTESFTYSDFMC